MIEGDIKVITFPEEERKKGQESEQILYEQTKREYSFLKKGNIDGYLSCRESFANLKIPDYRPNFLDMFNLAEGRPRVIISTLSTSDYRLIYYNNRIRSQDHFTEYLTHKLISLKKKKVIEGYTKEFLTEHGKCDLFIKGKKSFLLELKTDKIRRKDIYQCSEFKKGTNNEYPVIIIGFGCNEKALTLAGELGITVYSYSIEKTIPTNIKQKHIAGSSHPIMNLLFGHDYILKEWRAI
jgi:hypothetical protein